MKKIITVCFLAGTIYACNSGGSDTKSGSSADIKTEPTTVAAVDHTSSPEFQKGLDLVKGSDCATCHKLEEKVNGPAYRDIANKYTKDDATITMLAKKVISGGQGNWGNIPMVAHPSLPLDDAKSMVTYILLLKNN